MLKRTLFFGNPFHLHVHDNQMVVENKTDRSQITTVPIEDIGFVVCEHPQITFSTKCIQLLSKHKAALIVCDENYHPCSQMVPYDNHHLQQKKLEAQVTASVPLKKQLWQQIIKNKLTQQANVLLEQGLNAAPLHQKVARVKSGDHSFEEAKGAKIYWSTLMGPNFRRERKGSAPNAALNYGYAIIRACVARALTGAGLHPSFGIHHHNKYNAFCLADDIMEPFRPFVDRQVLDMPEYNLDQSNLDKLEKAHLLQALTINVKVNGQTKPLMEAVQMTAQSLSNCFDGTRKKLILPDVHQ